MNKLLSLALALVMVLSMAACTSAGDNNGTNDGQNQSNTGNSNDMNQDTGNNGGSGDQSQAPAGAVEVLQNIWALYGDDEKFFAMGGDSSNPVDNAPGAVDLKNTEFLTHSLLVPAAEQANITEAAALIHAMNANTFTGAVYKVSNAKAFAAAMKTAVLGNQWICGFPETLLIASVGNGYVVAVYGVNDAIDPFKTHMATAYPAAELLVNEAITG
ncbi:MAG: hypothetical protein J6Q53_06200 [Oscillospiraceae bacterium]|nr:hypothetical protein [Oscillospiraceae bacterium]